MMQGVIKPYECARCGERYEKNSDLVHHVKIHTSQDMFECVSCQLFFIKEDDFKKHKRSHRPIRVAHFGCNICGKEFSKLDLLKSHITSHEVTSDKYQCHECRETFSLENQLIAHRMLHDNQNDLACMSISSISSRGSAVSKGISKRHSEGNNNLGKNVVDETEEIDDDLELLLLMTLGD